MSSEIQGPTFVGPTLQPIIVHVAGVDRAGLEGMPELRGACTYVALFGEPVDIHTSAYVGMTTCGQDRPRVGAHLALASSIFVIADAGSNLTERDAQVLERFMFAKITESTEWAMRCGRPRAPGVGLERFAELMNFGCRVLVMMQQRCGLFADVAPRHLATAPREFEPIFYDMFRGPPKGEEMVLKSHGVEAHGVDMGDDGFAIRSGSIIRADVVPSAAALTSARREELLYNGQLVRLDESRLQVRRDLWRPSPTSAAKFVTGSSASAADWRPVKGPKLRLV